MFVLMELYCHARKILVVRDRLISRSLIVEPKEIVLKIQSLPESRITKVQTLVCQNNSFGSMTYVDLCLDLPMLVL